MSSHSLYEPAAQTGVVWRVWDPVAEMFCSSGRSLYAKNGRSVWMSKGAASVALGQMPADVKARAVVCAFNLVPVQPVLVQGVGGPMMTETELKEIEQRAAAATPGKGLCGGGMVKP